MPPAIAFVILAVSVLFGIVFGTYRYRTPANPLTIFSLMNVGLLCLFSGLVVQYGVRALLPGSADKYPDEYVSETALISAVYMIGACVPYFFRGTLVTALYGRLLAAVGLASDRIGARFDRWKFTLLLVGALLAFVALMVFSGSGMEWIVNPREAYGTAHPGSNTYWAFAQWFMVTAFIYYLWARRPVGFRLVAAVVVFSVLGAFLASKGIILVNIFIGFVYYQFRVRPVPLWAFGLLIALLFVATLALMILQGTGRDLLATLFYYQDYFDSTAWFLSRFDEFGFRYGGAALSSLWFFVPRGLYPDKPYYWGGLLVNQMLYPGQAENGYTPANLPWTVSYMDFGVVGVFVGGILTSLLQQAAFQYFLRHRRRLVAFLLANHLSLIPIYTLAPMPIALAIVWIQAVFLRLTLRDGGSQTAAVPAPAST